MPKVSRDTAQLHQFGTVEDRNADLDGGYTVNFTSFEADIDGTEQLIGLPNDQCPCPHWGYVFKGKLTFRTDHGDEVFGPGDAFYLNPGHIPIVEAGTEYLQFSPTEQMHAVVDHMVHRAQEMQARAQG